MLEIAQNYANALLSIAIDDNKVIEYQKEVKELAKIIRDNPDFLMLIDSRFLSINERKEKVKEILKGFSADIVRGTWGFLAVVPESDEFIVLQ